MRKHFKISTLWVLGAFCMMVGAMIAGRLDLGLGVTAAGFFIGFLIALVFFLVGGLMWLVAASGIKKSEEI